MDKILKHVLPDKATIIKFGQLDHKIGLELKMTTSLFENIDIVTDFYDEREMPYINNWTDVEGMGYGWAWLKYEEADWHQMMAKIVAQEVDAIIEDDRENTLYFIYQTKDVKTYHFIALGDRAYRKDVIVNFSNEELDF